MRHACRQERNVARTVEALQTETDDARDTYAKFGPLEKSAYPGELLPE